MMIQIAKGPNIGPKPPSQIHSRTAVTVTPLRYTATIGI
jgi:hypothetical protein